MQCSTIKQKIKKVLVWSQKITKTDMVYVAHGTFWLTTSQAISAVLSLLSAVAFGNLLSPETYGTYKYILVIIGTLAIFSLPGMNMSVMRTVAQGFRGSLKRALTEKITWGLIGGILSMILAAYYGIRGNSIFMMAFFMAAIIVPFMDSFTIYNGRLQGQKRFDLLTKYNVLIHAGTVLATIITLFLTDHVLFLLPSYLAETVFFRMIVYRKSEAVAETADILNKDTISYGKHLSVIAVVGTIASQLDILLLGNFLGATTVAIYWFALAPLNPVKTLIKSIVNLSLPKFANKDIRLIRKTLPKKIMQSAPLVVIPTILYILLVPFLFRWFFPQYTSSIFFAQLAGLSLLFFPEKFMGAALMATEKKKALYWNNSINAIAHIILLAIFVPWLGVLGAIISLLVHHVIALLASLFFFFYTPE